MKIWGPLKTMKSIISKLNPDKIFILVTVVCNNEINQKLVWFEKNYPWVKKENMIFISSTMLKPEVIIEYSKKYGFKLEDAGFIDDRLDVLRKAEEIGITVYHPSSFMEKTLIFKVFFSYNNLGDNIEKTIHNIIFTFNYSYKDKCLYAR